MSTSSISFKPKQVVKRLLSALSDRSIDIITKRYGLGKDPEPMTLDAIGKTYGITRERVRQIENHAIDIIRKSEQYGAEKPAFEETEKLIHKLGGIVTEKELLDSCTYHAFLVCNFVYYKHYGTTNSRCNSEFSPFIFRFGRFYTYLLFCGVCGDVNPIRHSD